MARGIQTLADLPSWLDAAQKDEIAVRTAHNENMQRGVLGTFGFLVTAPASSVEENLAGAAWELSTEHGEPVASRVERPTLERGYTFTWRDAATRWSRRWYWHATADDQAKELNNILVGDILRLQRELGLAAFGNAARVNDQGNVVYTWFNGDGEVPAEYNGRTFAAPHSHFATTGATTLGGADLTWLVRTITEHGYGIDGNGQLCILINPDDAGQVVGLRAGVDGSDWDFVHGQGAPAYLSAETIQGQVAPAEYQGLKVIGSYGPAYVVETSFAPVGYVAALVSFGTNSTYNALGVRQDPKPALQGLVRVPGPIATYPTIESFYARGIGTGVRYRGAGAVLQITANPTYTPPATYTAGA